MTLALDKEAGDMETAEMVQPTASFMAERKQIITKDGNISAVDSIPEAIFPLRGNFIFCCLHRKRGCEKNRPPRH